MLCAFKRNEKMDVKIDCEDFNFKYRVSAIILNDNKVLLVEMNNNDFLCCPGGHVELGEDSISAVKREIKEEIGIISEKVQLIALIENFFKHKQGKQCHEIGLYYLMECAKIPEGKLKDYEYVELDHGKEVLLKFKWIAIDEIDKYDIRPAKLKEILRNKKFDFNHILVQ